MAELDFEGRMALVTGGSRGIGRAISLALAARGAAVAFTYRADRGAAEAVLAQLTQMGAKAKAYQVTLDNADVCHKVVADVICDFGYVDAFISNAGRGAEFLPITDTSPAMLVKMMTINAFAPFWIAQAILPNMRARPRGDFVLISSATTSYMHDGVSTYNMSKAAAEALARTLAREERANGIHVNIVAPGLVDTDLGREVLNGLEKSSAELAAIMPFGRICQPEDIAAAVCFFLSAAASYITGEKLVVEGGPDQHLQYKSPAGWGGATSPRPS